MSKEKILQAKNNLFTWRKVYNNLCRGCQVRLTQTILERQKKVETEGTEYVFEGAKVAIENFCDRCKERTKKILEG